MGQKYQLLLNAPINLEKLVGPGLFLPTLFKRFVEFVPPFRGCAQLRLAPKHGARHELRRKEVEILTVSSVGLFDRRTICTATVICTSEGSAVRARSVGRTGSL